MKNLVLSLMLILGLSLPVCAEEFASIPYKNLKEKSKITYNTEFDKWSCDVKRKEQNYYTKTICVGSGSYSEFLNPDETFAFSTGSNYEFIHNGNLIGYSNQDLKFYYYTFVDGELIKSELSEEEVQNLFPDYKIVRISDFSETTNSLKIKKQKHNLKLIVLNDTDRNFYHYSFTSGNAKIKRYPLSGFVDITKKGMIQFSHFGDNTENNPWYILLVR